MMGFVRGLYDTLVRFVNPNAPPLFRRVGGVSNNSFSTIYAVSRRKRTRPKTAMHAITRPKRKSA
jgi:hypothetical protein